MMARFLKCVAYSSRDRFPWKRGHIIRVTTSSMMWMDRVLSIWDIFRLGCNGRISFKTQELSCRVPFFDRPAMSSVQANEADLH